VTDLDYAEVARAAGLSRVGTRPSLWAYLRACWERRDFVFTFARYRIEADAASNRFGLAWVVLRPLINAAVYAAVFSFILRDVAQTDNFIGYLVVGIFMFEYFAQSFQDGAKSITKNDQLVKSLNFPRALLPLTAIVEQVLELVPLVIVMCVIVLFTGEPLTWSWLLIIPALLLMTLFNTGVAFIAARLTVHFRDLTQIIPFVTRIMFYTTGVFFSVEAVLVNHPVLLTLVRLVPVHDYIAIIRAAVIEGQVDNPIYWIVGAVGGVVFLIFGFIFFWLAEERYGRD
jgi:teichoic acid transport system permease protein